MSEQNVPEQEKPTRPVTIGSSSRTGWVNIIMLYLGVVLALAGFFLMLPQSPLAEGIYTRNIQIPFSIVVMVIGAGLVAAGLRGIGRSSISATTPPPDITNDIEIAITQLNKNYEILRNQTNLGFLTSIAFMILGLVVIILGGVGELLGITQGGGTLTAIAGVITEFISATALYIHKINFDRFNATSDKLDEMWRKLAAFRKAEDLPIESKTAVMEDLIRALAGIETVPKP